MNVKRSVFAAGLMGLAVFAGAAIAADMNAIQERQACMKANGKMMGALSAIMKGEAAYDAAAVKAALEPMGAACANWDKFWGEDTKPGSEMAKATETWAKEEIWTKPDEFKKAGEAAYAASQALAATTDEAGFKAAFGGVANGCKGCHDLARRPKEG